MLLHWGYTFYVNMSKLRTVIMHTQWVHVHNAGSIIVADESLLVRERHLQMPS
jgi:hypothetical protein